ncbi:uncharacterized protein LOC120078560 [Benincasa hispida]|uniref:uncharacterized protein LOC120078560 n=1 Tax=Benincasa hispida TaxID=102211 RepID=UPI0019000F4C|nr:uncharacterized protein LOC120078560 [Benincasa hispida]
MDRVHGDVRRSTTASVVPPSVSSSHRIELIMPDTSSSKTEDVEVGQEFNQISVHCQMYWGYIQAIATVVGQLIKDKFTRIGCIYKPCHIVEDMRRDYDMNISYKAWCAREAAYDLTRVIPEYSYSILYAYGDALKIKNLGIVFEIKLEDEMHFKYMFMALGPYIRGFASCWPCIIVDGSHLKGKYKGAMLVVVSMDGNNQLYPLAYAIVDNETDQSWKWFMSNLKCSIGEPDNLVFVSDRIVSIDNAIRAFFSTTFHGLCTWHIEQNLVTNFKDSTVVGIFRDAARTFHMKEFQKKWDELRSFRDGVVTKYLEDIGLQRGMLQSWFYEWRNYWASRMTLHSDYCKTRLTSEANKGRRYRVEHIDCYRVHVRDNRLDGIVNLHTKKCAYKEFDSLGILCSHAIVAAKERNILIHSLCSQFYTVDSLMTAYAEPINPLGHISEWKRPSGYVEKIFLPPKFVPQAGRRRVRRIPSKGEFCRQMKCGWCGNYGHNHQNCTELLTTVRRVENARDRDTNTSHLV